MKVRKILTLFILLLFTSCFIYEPSSLAATGKTDKSGSAAFNRTKSGDYEISKDTYILTVCGKDGKILSLLDKSKGNGRIIDSETEAWSSNVAAASDASTAAVSVNKDKITFTFNAKDLRVVLHYDCYSDYIDVWADVFNNGKKTIKTFACPGALSAVQDGTGTIIFPVDWGKVLKAGANEAIETPCTADYMNFDFAQGQIAFYSVQPVRDRILFDKKPPYYLTATLKTRAPDKQHQRIEHIWKCWVPAGKAWKAPIQRIQVGRNYIRSIKDYAAANQYTKKLSEKMKPEVFEKFRQSISTETTADQISKYPGIVWNNLFLNHVLELHGWDKGYPQFLPLDGNLPKATSDQYVQVHKSGGLVGIYTNYLFWGKSNEWLNMDALRRLENGNIYSVGYGDAVGRSCFWHPDLRNKVFPQIDIFRDKYKADFIFTDQVSAEFDGFDFNPECPSPEAAFQGMIYCAMDTAKRLPVQVEAWGKGQWDAYLNAVSWYMVRQCGSDWSEIIPITAIEGHQSVAFEWKMDKIGRSVDNQEKLSACLVFGGIPHYNLGNVWGDKANVDKDWLDWMNALAKTVQYEYVGKEMTDFKQLSTKGVIQSQFGDMSIIANLTGNPYKYSDQITISARGFYAKSSKLEAGVTDYYKGNKTVGYKFVMSSGRKVY